MGNKLLFAVLLCRGNTYDENYSNLLQNISCISIQLAILIKEFAISDSFGEFGVIDSSYKRRLARSRNYLNSRQISIEEWRLQQQLFYEIDQL